MHKPVSENFLSAEINCFEVQLKGPLSHETIMHINNLEELRAVFQILMANIDMNGKTLRYSYLEFDEAHTLFLSYHPPKTLGHVTDRHWRKVFKDLLCHPKNGLPVYIVANKFIILKSRETDLELFLEELITSSYNKESQEQSRLNVTKELVDNLLESMDTSWDKKIVKVLLCAAR